jgi:hypothetical protein
MSSEVSFKDKVVAIETIFQMSYPDRFDNPEWQKSTKKYDMNKISTIINTDFSKENLKLAIEEERFDETASYFLKILKRSPMINVFEKVAMDNFLNTADTRKDFVIALNNYLHNFNAKSFEAMVSLLESRKLEPNSNAAKWPIMTFMKAYQFPEKFYVVKPTTAKKMANFFQIEINYTPRPTYKTYKILNKMVLDVKKETRIKANSLMQVQGMIFVAINQLEDIE